MNKYKVLLLSLALVFLSACGGGDDAPAAPVDPPNNNDAGYPNVVGTYAFDTSSFSYTCNDGEKGSNPGVSFNIGVSQTTNTITLDNKREGGTPGLEIIESTNMTGNVTKSSTFTTTQNATAYLNGVPGVVTLMWTIKGTFSKASWSGNYEYTAVSNIGSCTFKSTFSGEKVSDTAAIAPFSYEDEDYDLYQEIGRAFGN